MNAATEVKRHKLTQEDCDIARFFTRRGMKIKEIAKILKVDPSTVGKIQKADFRLETYLEQRKEMNRKTKERKAAAEAGRRRLNELLDPVANQERDKKILEQLTKEAEGAKERKWAQNRWPKLPPNATWLMGEEQKYMPPAEEVPGQMKMNLEPEKDPTPAVQEDTKSMMKFQAAMVDKLVKVLTEMIVTLDNRLTALDEIRDVLKGGERDE